MCLNIHVCNQRLERRPAVLQESAYGVVRTSKGAMTGARWTPHAQQETGAVETDALGRPISHPSYHTPGYFRTVSTFFVEQKSSACIFFCPFCILGTPNALSLYNVVGASHQSTDYRNAARLKSQIAFIARDQIRSV